MRKIRLAIQIVSQQETYVGKYLAHNVIHESRHATVMMFSDQQDRVTHGWRRFTWGRHVTDTHLLNIWEFVYFVWGLSPPKRRVVRRRSFAHRRVTTMCRAFAWFYVYRGHRYENNDIFQKLRARYA